MISRTLRAALLMFHTSAGYLLAAASKWRIPRAMFWAVPFTLRVLTCSGNDVGMPELACCVCHVVAGIHATPGIVVVEFQTTVAVYAGLGRLGVDVRVS